MTKPSLEIIVAMTRDRVIGAENGLPWHIPEDLQLFRRLTLGNTVIMGANTYRSIGAPLEERHNIVLSKSIPEIDGAFVCPSFLAGLAKAWEHGRPTFVIGGSRVYRKALKVADTLHISWIKKDFPGDRYFPVLDLNKWERVEESEFQDFDYVKYCHAKNKKAGD